MRRVFAVEYFPALQLDSDELPVSPAKPTDDWFSVSQLQPLLQVTFNRKEKFLEKKGRKPDYTLRMPLDFLPTLTSNQNLCMTIASRLGVLIPPHCLIPLETNGYACISQRFDRVDEEKLTRKSFDRILDRSDCYAGTVEEIGEKIRKTSEIPGLDVQLFFEMILLSFIIGHNDLHLKKFSVLYCNKRHVRLAPLEDIASTKLLFPEEEDFALPMMGKTNNITGEDFANLAGHLKIPAKSYERLFLRFYKGKRLISRVIKHSALEMSEKITFSDMIDFRFRKLMQ